METLKPCSVSLRDNMKVRVFDHRLKALNTCLASANSLSNHSGNEAGSDFLASLIINLPASLSLMLHKKVGYN
jgi:hypothetical protein